MMEMDHDTAGELVAAAMDVRNDDAHPRAIPAMQWKQTGCCPEAQADGVPCDDVAGACEACARSVLTLAPSSRH
jgi:hypothetical protein